MLKVIIAGLALVSVSAFADVELRGTYERRNCVIKNDNVSVTWTFAKEKDLTFTTNRSLKLKGVEKYAQVAASRAGTVEDEDMKFTASVDGKTFFILNQKDSDEALYLIQLMIKACN